jgi:hypothetical protein
MNSMKTVTTLMKAVHPSAGIIRIRLSGIISAITKVKAPRASGGNVGIVIKKYKYPINYRLVCFQPTPINPLMNIYRNICLC